MNLNDRNRLSAWSWVPGVYLAEGGPYMIVSVVSALLFKSLGMSNQELAFWSSMLMLPWAVKPLWTPLLDLYGSKRRWVLSMELAMAGLFLALSGVIVKTEWNIWLIALFFVLALVSATHDAAADGFYLIGLSEHDQAFFAGIRGTFYRIGSVAVQGGLVILAGQFAVANDVRPGWRVALLLAGGAMLALGLLHARTMPVAESPAAAGAADPWREFFDAFASFARRKDFLRLLCFLLFFRIAEAQLGKMAAVFMIDSRAAGGMALSLEQQGTIYGTIGVLALTLGGILGGMAVARYGLSLCFWPLVCAINVPDLVYVYLAWQPASPLWLTTALVAVEQFGYGLGFTAFMLVMVAAAATSGRFKTTHFAIMTGLSILGLILAGATSGYVQKQLGYLTFFWYVTVCTLPSFIVAGWVRKLFPPAFGRAAVPPPVADE